MDGRNCVGISLIAVKTRHSINILSEESETGKDFEAKRPIRLEEKAVTTKSLK